MQVAKWGNSLAIRIPASVAARLRLKAGDTLNILEVDGRKIALEKPLTREEALDNLRRFAPRLPDDYSFDRNALYERDE